MTERCFSHLLSIKLWSTICEAAGSLLFCRLGIREDFERMGVGIGRGRHGWLGIHYHNYKERCLWVFIFTIFQSFNRAWRYTMNTMYSLRAIKNGSTVVKVYSIYSNSKLLSIVWVGVCVCLSVCPYSDWKNVKNYFMDEDVTCYTLKTLWLVNGWVKNKV